MAVKYKIKFAQGETYTRRINYRIKATDGGQNTPVDITGFSASLTIRRQPESEPIIELTNANGGITLGGATGVITINITAEQSAALPAIDGVYDFRLNSPANVSVKFLIRGTACITRSITR